MASFIYGTEINLALESMIRQAESHLWFISPYIKLHDRIKDELKRRKDADDLQIVVVFGKNESDISKSISVEDINFLKEFPNVLICYEKNLHAKFYCNEDFSLITSMNLHQFSQNTNIEAGIILQAKNTIKKVANFALSVSDAGEEALQYFGSIIEHSEKLFRKTPQHESSLLGLKRTYKGSIVEEDKLENFLKISNTDFKIDKANNLQQKTNATSIDFKPGFCIRTGIAIPFNPEKPMCYEAWHKWSQIGEANYPEKYCHYSGEPSNGETSYSKPILRKNWSKAKSLI
jgi:hypothetical protein